MKSSGDKMRLNFEKFNGLIPAIIQDINTKEILMLGFMNEEAWEKTLETKKATFWSRTRKKLWTKGETSGNFLDVKEIFVDCDEDTLLLKVLSNGPTCHTGDNTCFHKKMDMDKNE